MSITGTNAAQSLYIRFVRRHVVLSHIATLAWIVVFGLAGCKTPWQRAEPNEPSFDHLLEIEEGGVDPRVGASTRGRRPGRASMPMHLQAESEARSESNDLVPSDLAMSPEDAAQDSELAGASPAEREQIKRLRAAFAAKSGGADKSPDAQHPSETVSSSNAQSSPGVSRSLSDRRLPENETDITFRMDDGLLESAPQTSSQRLKSDSENVADTPRTHPMTDQDLPSRRTDTPSREIQQVSAEGTQAAKENSIAGRYPRDSAIAVRDAEDSAVEMSLSDARQRNASSESTADELNSIAPGTSGRAVLDEPAGEESIAWEDHVRDALKQLAESSDQAANPDLQVRRLAISRLLSLSIGDLEAAMEPIEGLQANEQDYFRHQFKALYDAFDPDGNPVASRRWSLAMISQRKALQHLANASGLEINNAAFCTEVEGFGIVTKFANYSFKADQELLLYCELDNFVSESVKNGFETQLQGNYEIVDASGRRIANQLLPVDSHTCRNHRRDYFITYRMYMPQKVDPGSYTLKLTIEDMKGRKFGQSELDFQIVN